ncbi:hypothetical protein V6Z11_D11G218600 [Gossypium hirsutum]
MIGASTIHQPCFCSTICIIESSNEENFFFLLELFSNLSLALLICFVFSNLLHISKLITSSTFYPWSKPVKLFNMISFLAIRTRWIPFFFAFLPVVISFFLLFVFSFTRLLISRIVAAMFDFELCLKSSFS